MHLDLYFTKDRCTSGLKPPVVLAGSALVHRAALAECELLSKQVSFLNEDRLEDALSNTMYNMLQQLMAIQFPVTHYSQREEKIPGNVVWIALK